MESRDFALVIHCALAQKPRSLGVNSAAAEQRAYYPPDHRLCPRSGRLRGVSWFENTTVLKAEALHRIVDRRDDSR